jgi:4-amino-4-deoxy-L-arabinose transferase-like glycosyltransferase
VSANAGHRLLLIVAATLILRAPGWRDRFYSNDEATYSALAARVLSGGVMYADAVDHKPPGIVYTYAAVFRIAGTYALPAVRVLVAALVALTGIALSALAVNLTGHADAGIAGLLYVLVSATGFAPNTQAANTELMLNCPLAIAALLLAGCLRQQDRAGAFLWAAGAGLCTGAAALFKYQGGIALLAWALALVWHRRRSWSIAGLACGFAIPLTAVVAAFAAAGRLDALLFWGWSYNFQYIAALTFRTKAIRFITETVPIAAMWLPILALASFARRGTSGTSLVWWWCAAMGVAVSIGGRFFGNYFLMTAAPLSVLAGAGLAELREARPRLARTLLTAAVIFASASGLAAIFWDRVEPSERVVDEAYRAAGNWIREHSAPDDRLLVWGDSAQIYVYAGRLMATRFAFTNYHTGTIWGMVTWLGRQGPTTPALAVPRAWDELLDDMATTPPAFIADAAAGGLHYFDGQSIDRFPRLWSIVSTRYRYVANPGGIAIYRYIGS